MSGRGQQDERKRRDDGDRDRGDRDRKDRPRDRDRRDRRQRDRDRDRRDRDGRNVAANPIQGPIVLLKRPAPVAVPTSSAADSQTPSHSQSQPILLKAKSSTEMGWGHGAGEKEKIANLDPSNFPVLLQRPSTSRAKVDTSTSVTSEVKEKETKVHEPKEKEKDKEVLSKTPMKEKIQRLKKLTPIELAMKALNPFQEYPTSAITVIDNKLRMTPVTSIPFFIEKGKNTSDFFVVSVIGHPSSGKSTILNYLANQSSKGNKMFPKRERKNEMDTYMSITSDNYIYIEMASIFNCAATHDLSSQQGTLETCSLTWNLQLVRFALAVSHVVILVNDNLLDPNLFQLISSAGMIHPLESALGEGSYPEILYVCNKTSKFLDSKDVTKRSKLILQAFTGKSSRIRPNLFIIPQTDFTKDLESFQKLNKAIRQYARYNRFPHLPEKAFAKVTSKYSAFDWYCIASKVWEGMQHPNYFSGYVKLFP